MWKAFALILFFSLTISAQETKEKLYSRALKACLEKQAEELSKFTDRDLYNVIAVKDSKINGNLPTQFGKVKVEYLDYDQLAQKYKALPKKGKERVSIPVIRMFPIEEKDGKLSFGYSDYWFSYREKRKFFFRKQPVFYFALEGGCHAEIGFYSTEQKFVIEKVELWGI